MIPAEPESYQPLKSIFGPILTLHQLQNMRALTYWNSGAPYAKPRKQVKKRA